MGHAPPLPAFDQQWSCDSPTQDPVWTPARSGGPWDSRKKKETEEPGELVRLLPPDSGCELGAADAAFTPGWAQLTAEIVT